MSSGGWHLGVQEWIREWIVHVFGAEVYSNRQERVLRLLEETCELAQAEGVDAVQASKVLARVWSRDAASPKEELGDVVFTLLGYAGSAGQNIRLAASRAVLKAGKLDAEDMRRRHAAKTAAGTTSTPAEPEAEVETPLAEYLRLEQRIEEILVSDNSDLDDAEDNLRERMDVLWTQMSWQDREAVRDEERDAPVRRTQHVNKVDRGSLTRWTP